MPNYNFKCSECEAVCTVTQNVSDTPKTPKCLSCNLDMIRIYGTIAVQLKGGGWGSSN